MKTVNLVILVLCILILGVSSIISVGVLSTSIKLQSDIRDNVSDITRLDSLTYRNRVRDYQLDVSQDSIRVYDGNRLVGTMALQYDADPLGTMIIEDNQ